MQHDSSGNPYVNVSNVRITYVAADKRAEAKNWAGADVLRIQAYREGGGLHMGAEVVVPCVKDVEEYFTTVAHCFDPGWTDVERE